MSLQHIFLEAKNKDRIAQDILVRHFWHRMFTICERYVKNKQDVEERLQDGFVKFFRNIDNYNYDSDARLFSLLATIMYHECIKQLNIKIRMYIVSEPVEDDKTLEEEPYDFLTTEEIHKVICSLPDGYRIVFNLYVMEGLSHDEISKLLNISCSASRSQLTKAKKLLKKILSAKGIKYGKDSK